jgi:hypothetical protein
VVTLRQTQRAEGEQGDRDLLVVGLLLWVASVVRVVAALLEHEVFGAEASLALVCVVLIPWKFPWGRKTVEDVALPELDHETPPDARPLAQVIPLRPRAGIERRSMKS